MCVEFFSINHLSLRFCETIHIDEWQYLWGKERKDTRITAPRAAFSFNVSKTAAQIINDALKK